MLRAFPDDAAGTRRVRPNMSDQQDDKGGGMFTYVGLIQLTPEGRENLEKAPF